MSTSATDANKAEIQQAKTRCGSFWHEWAQGIMMVGNDQILLTLFMGMGIMMVGEGILEVLLVQMTKQILHGNASTLGWLMASQGAVALVGSFLIKSVSKFVQNRYLFMTSFVVIGLTFITIATVAFLPVALVLICIMGAFVVWILVTAQTLLQARTTDTFRGRVFGSYSTTLSLLMLIGMAFASVFSNFIGVALLIDIAGGFFLLSAFIFIKIPVTATTLVVTQQEAVDSTL